MTRADRRRLLDMREAVEDLTAIVDRGRSLWDDDKFARLAGQKLLEILGDAAKQVDDDVRARFPERYGFAIAGARPVMARIAKQGTVVP